MRRPAFCINCATAAVVVDSQVRDGAIPRTERVHEPCTRRRLRMDQRRRERRQLKGSDYASRLLRAQRILCLVGPGQHRHRLKCAGAVCRDTPSCAEGSRALGRTASTGLVSQLKCGRSSPACACWPFFPMARWSPRRAAFSISRRKRLTGQCVPISPEQERSRRRAMP